MGINMIFIILTIMAICYFQKRSSGAIETQWLISKFNHIGDGSNRHASSRHDTSNALFILTAPEQNNHGSNGDNNTRTCRCTESDNICCSTSPGDKRYG